MGLRRIVKKIYEGFTDNKFLLCYTGANYFIYLVYFIYLLLMVLLLPYSWFNEYNEFLIFDFAKSILFISEICTGIMLLFLFIGEGILVYCFIKEKKLKYIICIILHAVLIIFKISVLVFFLRNDIYQMILI